MSDVAFLCFVILPLVFAALVLEVWRQVRAKQAEAHARRNWEGICDEILCEAGCSDPEPPHKDLDRGFVDVAIQSVGIYGYAQAVRTPDGDLMPVHWEGGMIRVYGSDGGMITEDQWHEAVANGKKA